MESPSSITPDEARKQFSELSAGTDFSTYELPGPTSTCVIPATLQEAQDARQGKLLLQAGKAGKRLEPSVGEISKNLRESHPFVLVLEIPEAWLGTNGG